MTEQLLQKVNTIVKLTEAEEQAFHRYWTPYSLKKGEYLLRNGKICRTDNFVVEGALKAYFINPKSGKEEILYLAIEDWWATDMHSFQQQTPSIYNIQAVEDTQLLQISYESFQKLLQEIPKLERFFRIILESYLGALQQKIIFRQVLDAKERYFDFQQRYPLISARFPNYLIASYLNMSAEFLSRIQNA
ncbi:Crp/Fnr family transcriptional regulator [Zunongwangia pacifica]|uniref:Crp/Fnr family transcriptional regulator n=1 Tax=Zunongwangia pacifica TaxID=2911062 RepID=A0A9X2A095_9FLAO|nr:Crp/Fnr family transcriptional regulator [Zunongwangia pacifica]MCL6219701.1 Crp/Fnr family transcriptional regulator [Zunongwangia pacifica]